ncbi:MAG: hypothetical protein R3185_04550 [Candidatus Thermoplasmatota archaeon]|nr:hypothetical protein [Candidatus Thermoplasmatota archaeon]
MATGPAARPRSRLRAGLTLLVVLLAVSSHAHGHVPISAGDAATLADARAIHDVAKSWTLQSTLPDGTSVEYVTFEAELGERLLIQLLVGPSERPPLPRLTLMGPGLPDDPAPPGVQVPPDAGVQVVPLEPEAQPGYEPFGPGAYREIARHDAPAPATGTYVIAVSGAQGPYNLGIGYVEAFTLSEWLTTPFGVLQGRAEAGQAPLVLALPYAFGLAGVVLWAQRRRDQLARPRPAGWLLLGAGGLMTGSALATAWETVRAVLAAGVDGGLVVTLIIIALQAALATWALREVSATGTGRWVRARRLLLGALALFAWAGLIVGPLLAWMAALYPAWRGRAPARDDPLAASAAMRATG